MERKDWEHNNAIIAQLSLHELFILRDAVEQLENLEIRLPDQLNPRVVQTRINLRRAAL